MFWYTDIERTTRRLSQEALAIRFESHLVVAKHVCRGEVLTLKKPTGSIYCRPLSMNRTEVEIELKSGERHKEVIFYDE